MDAGMLVQDSVLQVAAVGHRIRAGMVPTAPVGLVALSHRTHGGSTYIPQRTHKT
jgi:hypothetical protein